MFGYTIISKIELERLEASIKNDDPSSEYVDGYKAGYKDGEQYAIFKKYTPNQIRIACGLEPIKDIESKERRIKMSNVNIGLKLKKGHAVAFDFDGVIHKYSEGWKDGSIYDEPNMEVVTFMSYLMKMGIPVFILSTRDADQINMWWRKQGFSIEAMVIDDANFWNRIDIVGITRIKLPAQLYIDDRGYNYHGQSVGEILFDFIKEE